MLSTSFFTGLALGIIFMLVCRLMMGSLVDMLGATAEYRQYSIQYATYVLYAALFMIGSFILNMCLRSEDSAMYAMIGIGFAVAFVLHTHSVVVWLVIYCLVTCGMSLYNPVACALVTDVIDDEEVRTGQRSDGVIQGICSFSRKYGSAISSGIRGVMLSAVGYTAATA